MVDQQRRYHGSHWGTFSAEFMDGKLAVRPFDGDPDPSALLQNIPGSLTHPARLAKPLIRRGWLENGPGPDERRGRDEFVEVSWDEALDHAATELKRLGGGDQTTVSPVPGRHVFGGSYGWSSAGRFHHAQSQVHRFLNVAFGGYVASVETYSSGAGSVILDTVSGSYIPLAREGNWWKHICDTTEMVLAFGGLPLRNVAVSSGGISRHTARDAIRAGMDRGCHFVSISPIRDDFDAAGNITWIAPRPATDVALMIGMAYHLHANKRVDYDYLSKYASGWETFEKYLLGEVDGQPKTPEWAASICGVPADQIRAVADEAFDKRTLVTTSYSLQRSENGEQPIWMALVLSAMLGGETRSGAGFSYGLGSIGNNGKPKLAVPLPTLPQGTNRSGDFIPVARIADLLLNPGATYTYRGTERRYADIRLVYWAGGNPFHHHQDLSKLQKAFSKPDTIIVHDSVRTATTAHADIVFPATITLEREDIGASGGDPFIVPMQKLGEAFGEARDDYEIFCDLARRLGCYDMFSEGRRSREWLSHLYDENNRKIQDLGHELPDFEVFMQGEPVALTVTDAPGMMDAFHADPEASPLQTASGRIQISSDLVASSGLPGHPAWLEPTEWLSGANELSHPFQLVANQPRGRLHSQLDFGPVSMAEKMNGREVVRINTDDALRLGIAEGDVVKIWNARGAVLAAASPSDAVLPSVLQLSTGAWYAPQVLSDGTIACVNGNPNAVTSDRPASAFSQGCSGQLCMVSIEKPDCEIPDVVPHGETISIIGGAV